MPVTDAVRRWRQGNGFAGVPQLRRRAKGDFDVGETLIEPGLEQGLGELQLPDDAFARDAFLLQAILNLLLRIGPGQALAVAARQVLQRALAIELGHCEGRLFIHEDPGNQIFARHEWLLRAQFGRVCLLHRLGASYGRAGEISN
jgi:hypothetical protein